MVWTRWHVTQLCWVPKLLQVIARPTCPFYLLVVFFDCGEDFTDWIVGGRLMQRMLVYQWKHIIHWNLDCQIVFHCPPSTQRGLQSDRRNSARRTFVLSSLCSLIQLLLRSTWWNILLQWKQIWCCLAQWAMVQWYRGPNVAVARCGRWALWIARGHMF